MARILLGCLCGALLSGLRAPLGFDLLALPAVPAGRAYFARALALVATAGVVLLSRRSMDGRPNGDLLLAVTLGYGLEGWMGGMAREAASAPFPLAMVALVLLVLREQRRVRPAGGARGAQAGVDPLPAVTPLALVFGGAGTALGLEGIGRILRRMGGGLPLDDTLFGVVFLGLAAVGGLAFGRALRSVGRDRARGPVVSLALGVGGAALFVGLMAASGVATPPGLRGFLARFGSDPSRVGQLPYDALIASVVLVVPAFALGTALYCARRPVELAALLLGAAAGHLLAPGFLGTDGPPADGPPTVHSAQLVRLGALLVGLGTLAAARHPPRIPHAVLGVALIVTASAVSVRQVVVRAWSRFPIQSAEVFDTPEGQILIRPSGPLDQVTLDHRPLTPLADGARADAERLRTSLALLPQEVRARGVRVLLVGQLTPGRALVLAQGGVTHLDRSAAWWRVMGWLEARLFRDHAPALPAALGLEGEVLDLVDARARLGSQSYDLVIVPPVPGPAPLVPRPRLPAGTAAVAWLDAGSAVARREIGGPVVLASDGFEGLSIGVVFGIAVHLSAVPDRPAVLDAGPPLCGPSTLEWMALRGELRPHRARADLAERLAAANADGPWAPLTAALAAHYLAQRESSPWESGAQATELVDETLEELTLAANAARPDRYTRELWNGLASVLMGKRDVEKIVRWIRPVAEVWAPWPELEIALALAELESLEPQAAAARLEPLLADPPTDPRWRRWLAVILARAGALEQARPLLLELWEANPADLELRELLDGPPSDGGEDG